MVNSKYNFIIFSNSSDYYKYSYADIQYLDNAVYISNIYGNLGWKALFFYLHISKRANKYVRWPFKSFWNRHLFCNPFKNDKPLCFVFFGSNLWFTMNEEAGFLQYLRKAYPDSKSVLFLHDLAEKTKSLYSGKAIDMIRVKSLYACVFSYDKGDCWKYGLLYHPTVFSCPDIEENDSLEECDVYFLGKAKERLSSIIDTYDRLSAKGLKCKFYLTGVSVDKQLFRQGIVYMTKMMSYKENLQRVKKCKCILEIMQGGAEGFTFRIWEAVVFKRYLLTNNYNYTKEIIGNSNFVILLDKQEEDLTLESIKVVPNVDEFLVEKISPVSLLDFIECNI